MFKHEIQKLHDKALASVPDHVIAEWTKDKEASGPTPKTCIDGEIRFEFQHEVTEHGNEVNDKVTPMLCTFDDHFKPVREILNKDERQLLSDLENIITNNWEMFCEVGTALYYIKDFQLYKESHGSFTDYCKDTLNLKHINDNK